MRLKNSHIQLPFQQKNNAFKSRKKLQKNWKLLSNQTFISLIKVLYYKNCKKKCVSSIVYGWMSKWHVLRQTQAGFQRKLALRFNDDNWDCLPLFEKHVCICWRQNRKLYDFEKLCVNLLLEQAERFHISQIWAHTFRPFKCVSLWQECFFLRIMNGCVEIETAYHKGSSFSPQRKKRKKLASLITVKRVKEKTSRQNGMHACK